MRKTLSKIAAVLYLSSVLMMGLGLSLGCAVPSVEAQSLQNASEVRQPQGDEDLEAFWNKFDWQDLTATEQALWQVLGWTEASWDGSAAEPASESKDWNELTDAERSAAGQLGYDEQSWNATL